MRRREFLGVLGGTAVAWPLAVRAQQTERVRRIGMLMASAADDPEFQSRVEAFHQALGQLGWVDGRNVRIDTRWATTNSDDLRRHAAELAALAPDVLVAGSGTATVAPLLQATRTVPIVFVIVVDPVGAGFVASLARPGGNSTGFTMFEYGMSGAQHDASGGASGSDHRLRDRPVCLRSGRGPLVGGGVEPGRRSRCRRYRARRRGLRALRQWRPDRDGERAV